MDNNLYLSLKNLDSEELMFLEKLTENLDESQKVKFLTLYSNKRRDPQLILIATVVGFVGTTGIQRFLTEQIAMGLLYFFTGGLCFIGTIIDIINYKKNAFEFNQVVAAESIRMII